MTTNQLLRRYVADRSDAAFAPAAMMKIHHYPLAILRDRLMLASA